MGKRDGYAKLDRAELTQKATLGKRREERTHAELDAVIEAKNKEIEELKAARGGEGGGGSGIAPPGGWQKKKGGVSDSTDVRALQKDVGELHKKIRRLESERDSAIETRDSLSRRLKDAEASLGSDTRLIETNRELSRAQAAVASLSSQYKTVANEREIFETRVKQLESGAASTAEIKREKERKEFMERVDKMEEKIARLETDKINLAGQLRAAKVKLESPDGAFPAQEKKSLETSIAELTLQAQQAAARIEAGEGGNRASTDQSSRYRDLLANLRLSEDDVSTLLSEGADWPPVRAEMPSSSLIDLLWLLDDEHSHVDDEHSHVDDEHSHVDDATKNRIKSLEEEVSKLRREAGKGNGGARNGTTNGMRTPPRSRSSSRSRELVEERNRLREELEEVRTQKEWEKETLEEKLSNVKERLAAFEANRSNGRPASPSSSGYGTNSVSRDSASGRRYIDGLRREVTQLTEENATLRDENTELLLKLVGVEL